MGEDQSDRLLGRRDLLKAASLAGAGALVSPLQASAEAPPQASPAAPAPADGPSASPESEEKNGSDFMLDVIKSTKIEYVAGTPAANWRGLHESILNYGGNRSPELLTSTHEESAVALAHGYAKATGKPMIAIAHGTVGLQHAAMALYNAWCDRAPVITIIGNAFEATDRRPGVEWYHSAQDPAAMVRDYVKWDDQPASLQAFGESFARAYQLTLTPPMAPVVLVAQSGLQESRIAQNAAPRIPRVSIPAPPQGDANAVREAAKILCTSDHPVIVVERAARSQNGVALLVQLAEALGAPVIDLGGRMNFPTTHDLAQTERAAALVGGADAILALEVADLWGALNEFVDNVDHTVTPRARPGVKVISVNSAQLYIKANYQDFQRYAEVDIAIAADAEATLPSLLEGVRGYLTASGRGLAKGRRDQLKAAKAKSRNAMLVAAAAAWDASPITTARVSAELWSQIKNTDWALVSADVLGWPRRLWPFDRHDQYLGGSGGYGLGYGLPAAIGAALAFKESGRIAVNIQSDGDLLFVPGALWMAVHHKVPLLTVMHNNRAYHQEVMHVQRMANRRNRGVERTYIGTTLQDPFIDYAMMARSMGMWAEGPISEPAALGPALRRAVEIVKRGEPALVDVVTQPR